MYYAGEQMDKVIMEEYFNKIPYSGNCIEVGMGEGIVISNTYHFEQRGWKVLCIEPNPIYFESCKAKRQNVLPYACGKENKDDVEFTIYDIGNGTYGSCSALSSDVDERLVKQHQHMIQSVQKVKVPLRTLDWILENAFQFDEIDWLSIDTEGNELDVLKGFDIEKWKPKLFLMENNYNEPEVEEYLKTFGYRKDRRMNVNDLFVRNDIL